MLLQRLKKADADERPLLAGVLSSEGLAALYESRKKWYAIIPLVFRPHEEKLETLLDRLVR
jgi:shikimate kinase